MQEFEKITPGLTSERSVTIEMAHAATHTKTPVLSTPMMIGMMEGVSKDLVDVLLPSGFITVGYEVHVKHKAAVPVGGVVKVSCKVLEVDGRRLLFEVRVAEGDKIVGEGQHRRTIIPYSE